ncbi:MAG: transcriptional regulator FtsR [Actinomycetota bacterium]
MASRDYKSIGEVLVELKPEFPDVTISKIRFLESEGLINPERTRSGYRKFFPDDVERLRMILKLQRHEYLPLKVIRERLETGETAASKETPAMTAGRSQPDVDDDVSIPPTDVQMTREEMASATGVDAELLEELESFGFLHPHAVNGAVVYNGDDLAVVGIVKGFFKYGVEPRHLTMYRHFAEREATFFQAIILPILRQRNPDARRSAATSLSELAGTSKRLKQALLRSNLRPHLDG